ncbi:MAG: AAC(3) family N-acetyltransferase [Bacteroidota bacterium]|nr:AAC(3) family N-acetyltransferase [Bacteroidota bacterium]
MDINEIGLHLSNQWMKSGIVQGDLVLVHSSAKPLMIKIQEEFELKITPLEIFQSLQLAVGSSGTLIFPLFNFTAWPQNKKFDIRSTPSEMWGLSELSRNHPDSIRTGHPIYSFSIIGAKSDLFKNIDNVSGYCQDSVFALLKNFNGKIAIIGLPDQTSMTSYHYVEEANNVHYRYFKNFIGTYIDAQGNELEKTYKLFVRNLDIGVHKYKPFLRTSIR